MENHESLKACAVVCELADTVKNEVDNFFSDGVVSSCEVVCSIFFTGDELLRVEELSVCACTDFIYHGGLQIDKHTSRNVFARTCFTEESVECIVTAANRFVAWHLAIGLNSVLEAEELPARISDLDASLADVDGKSFTHG
jgi:hypothetical protein